MKESTRRSLVKTISWRIIGSGAAMIIAYAVTGSLSISSTIGIVHLITNTILYYFHERTWARIRWGRE